MYFEDRGSNVLCVAHVDCCDLPHAFRRVRRPDKPDIIMSPQLDDRLGVYTVLRALYPLGMDILLTDDEETALSTAAYFIPPRQYNWVVEFDRRGRDVVTYQYHVPEVYGYFDVGVGTYSDIVDMEHLGVACFNVGIGFHKEHTEECYANPAEWEQQMEAFERFFDDFKDVPLGFEERCQCQPISYELLSLWMEEVGEPPICPYCGLEMRTNG